VRNSLFIGQEKTKDNLRIIVQAAKKRAEPCCEHLLFYGGSGLGKTSLAHVVAREIGTNIRITSGPAVEKIGDLAAILTNLAEGDILFIDEIHRLNRVAEEVLYSAMEDYKLNLILGKGPMARTMELPLTKFTLIGATTKLAMLSSPLRSRFGATFQLDFYKNNDIENIIRRSAKILDIKIDEDGIKTVASRSRFNPRVANRLLKRVRDFAQVEGSGTVDKEFAEKALDALEIDSLGLEMGDRKILHAIIDTFSGGPVGLQALSAATSEEEDTILDIYEPYLMQVGFIERTARGRMATKKALDYLKTKKLGNQNILI